MKLKMYSYTKKKVKNLKLLLFTFKKSPCVYFIEYLLYLICIALKVYLLVNTREGYKFCNM